MQRGCVIALALSLLCITARADIFSGIGDAINSVANTATTVADTVTDSVTDATNTVSNAVGDAVSTSTNAIQSAAGTVSDTAQHTIDVSERWITNTANTASNAVVNFTQDQWNAASGVADQVGSAVSDVTGQAVSVGRETAGTISSTATSVTGSGTPPPQGIDATNPEAIFASLAGAGGFTPVALGILQGLAGNRAAAVADASAAVLSNASLSQNETTQVGVAQAWTAAIAIAQNQTEQVQVNGTQVAEAYMASLQNVVAPCAANLGPLPALGSPEYTQTVSTSCCPTIDRTLTTSAMVSDLLGVDAPFYAALQESDAFGTSPQFNLGRCLTDQTEIS